MHRILDAAIKLGKRVKQGKRGKTYITGLSTHGCLPSACASHFIFSCVWSLTTGTPPQWLARLLLPLIYNTKRFKSTLSLLLTEIACLNDIHSNIILPTVMGSIPQPPIGLSNLQPPNNVHGGHVQLSSAPAAPQNVGQHYPQAPPQHPQQANNHQIPVPYPIANANGAQYPVSTFQKPSLDEADDQPWR